MLPDSEGGGPDDILTRMKDRNMRGLSYLINKPPRWNEQVGAYVLNFNGRVTMASVKNFQLVDPDEQNAVVLQVRRARAHMIPLRRCAAAHLLRLTIVPPCCFCRDSVRSRRQRRVHHGHAAPDISLPGLRSDAQLLRLEDCVRLIC